jgi:hypothetical protein
MEWLPHKLNKKENGQQMSSWLRIFIARSQQTVSATYIQTTAWSNENFSKREIFLQTFSK